MLITAAVVVLTFAALLLWWWRFDGVGGGRGCPCGYEHCCGHYPGDRKHEGDLHYGSPNLTQYSDIKKKHQANEVPRFQSV